MLRRAAARRAGSTAQKGHAVAQVTEGSGGAHEEDWLTQLLGRRAADVLRAYSVTALRYAHAQAAWRYRLATWTNENTYGTDRFHCLVSVLGTIFEERVPGVRVHRPTDEWGSPFLVEVHRSALYVFRYGDTAEDSVEGFTPPHGWLRDQIFQGSHADQGVLDFPNLPDVPLSRIVVLAYAGNRHDGVTRAFVGLPYLQEGLLWWRQREPLSLDVEDGSGVEPMRDDTLPPRHSLMPAIALDDVPPPQLDLKLVDDAGGFDWSMFTDDEPPDDEPDT
jgi:hypothetical protein